VGDRLATSLDAVLHLLDRQVVDVDDLEVCKVDDLELTAYDDGTLAVTALLAGSPALVPRMGDGAFGEVLHDFWRRLGPEAADRDDPYRIDLGLVDRLGSGVELSVPRRGLLVRQGQSGHRLNTLLQMTVRRADGTPVGRVLDVRLEREPGDQRRLRVVGLIVGRGWPGSYFGYERRADMGPWLVSRVVRWLHRHSGYLPVDAVEIGWGAGVVSTRADRLEPLEAV
jgi:hypothetical protein